LFSSNVYDDPLRASTYDKLEFSGTYYLAYRDIPEIIKRYVRGKRALDFGCGTGRSTRFLKKLGLEVTGIDVAPDMIELARKNDPAGNYQQIEAGKFNGVPDSSYNLVLSAFTFDNISETKLKAALFNEIHRVLIAGGILINLVSSPEIYLHEWVSFSTRDFPENRLAKSGDPVKIIITDTDDKRPVIDTVFSDEAYHQLYDEVGLTALETLKPLATGAEPYSWINETRIAPWMIYVLQKGMA